MDLDAELDRARDLGVSELADTIKSIDFKYARRGACCKDYEGDDDPEPHMVTVFPDEAYALQGTSGDDSKGESGTPMEWQDVARPMPYGFAGGDDGPEGEAFGWALRTTVYGGRRSYEGNDSGRGAHQVYEDRPFICETYPFSAALGGTS